MSSRFARAFRVVLATVMLVSLAGIAAPAVAAPTTWYVDPVGGNNTWAGTTEQTALKTLHEALTVKASSGDTVIALPGTYSAAGGQLLAISFPAGVTLTSRDGAATTIIDCNGNAYGFEVSNATVGTEISGFTITDGESTGAGGMQIYQSALPVAVGWPIISDNIFDANNGVNGGGIYIGGQADRLASPRIYDNEFKDNTTGSEGAGIYIDGHGNPTISRNTFYMNTANRGGAISLMQTYATITDNTFDTNYSVHYNGAAIHSEQSTVTVKDNYFVDNDSDGTGGAIYVTGGLCEITENDFYRNEASWNGGAIALNLIGDAEIFNNLIRDNVAGDYGGAVRADDTATNFINNTVYGNTGTDFNGVYNMGGTFTVFGCILWGHADEDLSGVGVDYSCTEDTNLADDSNSEGAGVIHSNPLFFDVTEDDYRLKVGSPCIDAAAAGTTHDFLGTSRPQDGDGNGPALYDMGYWERPTPEVARVAGDNRYSTAADAATEAFPSGSDTAVIANGMDFPDALSAAGLCGMYDAPLLLTSPTSLSGPTAQALSDLGVTDVVIVGGTSAVSTAAENTLKASYSVTRISGTDRYDTSAKVAEEIESLSGAAFNQWAFIARGDSFPDALSVSPYSYDEGTPILLTKPGSLPSATKTALESLDIEDVIIPGGTAAVSGGVKTQIDGVLIANGGKASLRLSGSDRYDTAATIAGHARTNGWGDPAYVGIATGEDFPDALAGGVATGVRDGSILLTAKSSLPGPTSTELGLRGPQTAWCEVFGGTSVVSDSVRSDVFTALGW